MEAIIDKIYDFIVSEDCYGSNLRTIVEDIEKGYVTSQTKISSEILEERLKSLEKGFKLREIRKYILNNKDQLANLFEEDIKNRLEEPQRIDCSLEIEIGKEGITFRIILWVGVLVNIIVIDDDVPPETKAVLREKEAFLAMEKNLIKECFGKCVAIINGKIAGIGDNEIELAIKIYKERGYIPMYLTKVGEKERVIRIPSPRIRL
ncbi:MAG: hypothetical protein AB1630_00960 [bacterium]